MRSVIIAIAISLAGVAMAAPKPDPAATQAKADALFVKGQASYQDGKFQAAIAQFKQAYDLVRDPIYLFNIALPHLRAAIRRKQARNGHV